MKHSLTAVVAVAILAAGSTLAAHQAQQAPPTTAKPKVEAQPVKPAATPAGKWVMNLEGPQAMTLNLEVKIDAANKVTGTLESPNGPTPITGEWKDGVLGFSISFDAGGTAMEIYFESKLNAEGKLAGTMSAGDMGSFPFSAERAKGI